MKILIAGFGNIFFSDDGYGVAAAQLLAQAELPSGVRVVDFGIRGMHAAFEMLNGYDAVIFLDAMPRGDAPGTLHAIEPDTLAGSPPDAHAMELHHALSFYERLCRDLQPSQRPAVRIVGCEPGSLGEGIGLSDAVACAVERTPSLVLSLLADLSNRGTPV